tara:strand:- start:11730 stop:12455 length:726 start_codon:yes stop_codon:yes gene_type:complete
MIYEYALTEDAGLIKETPLSSLSEYLDGRFCAADGPNRRRSNQLKVVCRQLHDETVGMELALNTLTFQGRTEQLGLDIFMHFVTHECSLTHKSRMRDVIIADSCEHATWETTMHQLRNISSAAFKTQFYALSMTRIKIHLVSFSSLASSFQWIFLGSAIQYAIGGTIPVTWVGSTSDLKSWVNRGLYDFLQGSLTLPLNVHIYPAPLNDTEYRTLRAALLERGKPVDPWVQQFRSWCEHGF